MANDNNKLLDINGLQYFYSKLSTILNNKVDKNGNKQLSTEDFTSEEKQKLKDLELYINELQSQINEVDAAITNVGIRYGVKVDKNNSDPSTRVSYIYDSVGFTPAKMVYNTSDPESSYFDYGSWKNVFFVKNNYPCMVKYDGTEDYKLDPNDHSLKEDGTPSDVANLNYEGNAMSCFNGRIWLKEWQDDNYEYYVVSNVRYDEDYHDYAFICEDGTHTNKLYCPMFKGSSDGTRLRSISGTYPHNKTTTTTELSMISANGDNWQPLDYAIHELISVLLLIMSCNDNSQAAFGQGCTTGGADNAATHYGFAQAGVLNTKGQFFGYTATAAPNDVKVFYMQSYWGNRWDRMLGLITINEKPYVKWYPPYNLTADGYIDTGVEISQTSGYQKTTSNEYGRLCTSVGGSQTTYNCDYYYWSTGTHIALFGGYSGGGAGCGSWCVYLGGAASCSYWFLGASPYLKIPGSNS